MKTVHYFQVSLAVLVSAAMTFATSEPQYTALAHTVASMASSLLMALGLASGAVGSLTPPAAPAPPPVTPSNPLPVRITP